MSFLSGLFSGNTGPSYEKEVVGAFGKTVGALQRKEEGDGKKRLRDEEEKERARATRHDDLGGKYVSTSQGKIGISTPGDPSERGGGKKRRKSRRKKRRKSRRKKRRKSRRNRNKHLGGAKCKCCSCCKKRKKSRRRVKKRR